MSEYVIVAETSALALSVAGMLKEIITILAAIWFWNDRITIVNGLGFAISIIGLALFNYFKFRRSWEDAKNAKCEQNCSKSSRENESSRLNIELISTWQENEEMLE